MSASYDVVVIGGGQSGLAAGYHLDRHGLSFTILDAHERIGDAWRHRWDSLRLFTPRHLSSLPGLRFPGDGYPTKDQVADYLELYAAYHALPVQSSTRVARIRERVVRLPGPSRGYVVESNRGDLHTSHVIVATGAFRRPRLPELALDIAPTIHQLHAAAYRNPAQIVGNRVLVIGAGNSGVAIALDLAPHHRVWLAGRSTGRPPPRLFNRLMWRVARRMRASERTLRDAGVSRIGRITQVIDGRPGTSDGPFDVDTIVWATGYELDHSWFSVEPVRHHRGVVGDRPGLYLLGPSVLGGIGRDAAYVVGHIARSESMRTRPRRELGSDGHGRVA